MSYLLLQQKITFVANSKMLKLNNTFRAAAVVATVVLLRDECGALVMRDPGLRGECSSFKVAVVAVSLVVVGCAAAVVEKEVRLIKIGATSQQCKQFGT